MIYIVFTDGKPGEMTLDRDAAMKDAADARESDASKPVVVMALDGRVLSEHAGEDKPAPHHRGKK